MTRDQLIAAISEAAGLRFTLWAYLLDCIGGPEKLKTKADSLAFALGVDAFVEYIEIQREIILDGRFWHSQVRDREMVKRHPGVEPMSGAWARVMGVLDRFGMNPAARGQVKQTGAEKADEEADAWGSLGQLA